jgi:hypothetical protein
MKRTIILLSSGLLLLGSCTGNFREIKDGYFGLTTEDVLQDNNVVGSSFPDIMRDVMYVPVGGEYIYQRTNSLSVDTWSGYTAWATDFGLAHANWVVNADWNNHIWNDSFYNGGRIFSLWLDVNEALETYGVVDGEQQYPHFVAINNILKAFGGSRVADIYGPIIYSHYGEELTGSNFDSLEDAYDAMLTDLTEAADVLDDCLQRDVADISGFDIVYNGDLAKWARLANTLRLRLALRIVKADPAKAQAEAEAAINHPQGVMVKGDSYIMQGAGRINPLYNISLWTDIHMSANMQSILGGYGDPRLLKFGNPVEDQVVGIRMGVDLTAPKPADYKTKISSINVTSSADPYTVMQDAEARFLLAEAALRGWNAGGTAEEFYEAGVQMSFDDWAAGSADGYLASTATPADWVDPIGATENNIAAMSDVTPAWDEALSDEEKLEKIITQKWIAGFPEGYNAWAEWRRTGYPKLFPTANNGSGGVVDSNLGFRRMPYVQSVKENNAAGYADATSKLGGPDDVNTRLWWDVDKGNF